MTITQLPNFTLLDNILQDSNFPLNAAECHGLAAGIICVTDDTNSAFTALFDLFPSDEINQPVMEEAKSTLETLCKIIKAELIDPNFAFQLLLPNDECSLTERSTAVSQWCRSFISGLGEGGVKFESDHAQELQEIVSDLIAIGQVDTQEITDTEEEEVAFTELVEYVRVAAITIYTDLLLENKNMVTPDTSHHIH